ncbi:hypothetical protein Prudu_001471, partial [Prunus dulcis]
FSLFSLLLPAVRARRLQIPRAAATGHHKPRHRPRRQPQPFPAARRSPAAELGEKPIGFVQTSNPSFSFNSPPNLSSEASGARQTRRRDLQEVQLARTRKRQIGLLCPTFAKCRTRTGFDSNSKAEFGSGPVIPGYGHISSECANTLKKQKDGKNKALHTTWSDSDSDYENNEKAIALITTISYAIALITTVSLDEPTKKDDDCEDMNIEFIMNKYDDLLAASQKLSKQNEELVKSIVVLKLENCKIANKFQSSDIDSEKKKLTR